MDIMNSFSLKGKVAMVTGASYGIGYAIAKGLAAAGAKIVVRERLLTDGDEYAKTDFDVILEGEGAGADVVSRSVAKGNSKQEYYSRIVGKCPCTGHTECDAIIMDEATSALDNESEKLVQESLERLAQGRTTLTIAHRLTTIRNADKIVVLDGGHIHDVGTHAELLSRCEIYKDIYLSQTKTEDA